MLKYTQVQIPVLNQVDKNLDHNSLTDRVSDKTTRLLLLWCGWVAFSFWPEQFFSSNCFSQIWPIPAKIWESHKLAFSNKKYFV